MSQLTFAEAEYAIKKRTTRREKFLARLGNWFLGKNLTSN